MKERILVLLLLSSSFLFGQVDTKTQAKIGLSHHSLSLVVPQVQAIHPGVQITGEYQWNSAAKHALIQSGTLEYFYHQNLQHAIQLYTDLSYELRLANGLHIRPLEIGGGYVLSISDLETAVWNEDTEQYESANLRRNNWVISLGPEISYPIFSTDRTRARFFADYKIQVQGIVIQETVPIIAYAPVSLGLSIQFLNTTPDEK